MMRSARPESHKPEDEEESISQTTESLWWEDTLSNATSGNIDSFDIFIVNDLMKNASISSLPVEWSNQQDKIHRWSSLISLIGKTLMTNFLRRQETSFKERKVFTKPILIFN